WSFHHLLLDGWSMTVLNREILACYEAFTRGAEPDLPPVSPYRDYIQWLQKRDRSRAEAFWRQALDGITGPTRIQDDGAASSRSGQERFQEVQAALPEETSAALLALARRSRVTPSTLVQAVWALLLSRLSGEEDVTFGMAFSGRPPDLPGVEAMVGLFIGTVPVRARVPPGASFTSWVKQLQQAQIEMQEHQHTPLVDIQAWSKLPRGGPLFESLFVFESYPAQRAENGDLSFVGRRYWAHTNYPLHLRVLPGPPLLVSLTWDTSRLGPEGGRALLDQVVAVLEQVAANPEAGLDSYSLVASTSTPPERQPAAPIATQDFEPVITSFERQARAEPSLTALRQGARSMGYGELLERARAVGAALVAGGLRPGDVVALDGESSFGLIAGLLGAMFAGGACLMLERRLPVERRRLMCARGQARFLVRIGEEGVAEEELGLAVACRVDGRTAEVEGAPRETGGLPALGGDDAAYVFFTSGTTGLPKGVLGTHRGLGHFVTWQRETFDVGRGDRVAQLTSLSFDVVLREIFLPLTSGASLCLPEHAGDLGADRVLPWLEREGITVVHTVPSLAQSWLTSTTPAKALPSLRRVFFAGEPLPGALVKRWREVFSFDALVVNLYGPTETTLAKCFYVVPADPGDGVQPVGRPLPGAQALVVAERDRLCGALEWGEVVLRTPYRTRGYVGASEEDLRRFAPNPFRDDPQDVVYRTGDRGRYRADGVLELRGRLDDQIKVRGVRVEPGEVEAALRQHASVKQAAVLGRSDGQGGKRLVAYVVANEGAPAAAEVLRAYLQAKLPEAFVPSSFVVLAALPLTANGKLDRAALPEPSAEELLASGPGRTAPRNAVEEEIAGLWREVLGLEAVGVHDDFFGIGGHSLHATQVVARMRAAFRVELAIRRLYENPTVAGLAEAVEAELRGGAAPALAISPRTGVGPAPLSFSQQRLWFLDQFTPGGSAYNIATAARLEGPLHPDALERALLEIVRRHEVLRTTFEATGGEPVQRVHPLEAFQLRRLDLRATPADARLAEAERLAAEEAEQPFDLAKGPLFRAALLQLGDADHVLLTTFHHTVSDAWSLDVFAREAEALYSAYRDERPVTLAKPPVQYGDYAQWQREWLSGEVLEQQLGYWKRRLGGALPTLDLPTDRPRPPVPTFRGSRQMIELPKALREDLLALGRREGGTLFTTLMAAWNVLLHRYTGQDDLLVGVPIAGRSRAELEGLIGLFVNTLVVRTSLAGDPTFRELLARVREVMLEAYAHPDLPFEKLVEELQPERELSRNPLFQVMLALYNAPWSPFRLDGVQASLLPTASSRARFDLTLSLLETKDGLLAGL
ncbi:MAG TPA: amino acid adenylation domain-containing protein, partial [Vicinamibacteria bacterium]